MVKIADRLTTETSVVSVRKKMYLIREKLFVTQVQC